MSFKEGISAYETGNEVFDAHFGGIKPGSLILIIDNISELGRAFVWNTIAYHVLNRGGKVSYINVVGGFDARKFLRKIGLYHLISSQIDKNIEIHDMYMEISRCIIEKSESLEDVMSDVCGKFESAIEKGYWAVLDNISVLVHLYDQKKLVNRVLHMADSLKGGSEVGFLIAVKGGQPTDVENILAYVSDGMIAVDTEAQGDVLVDAFRIYKWMDKHRPVERFVASLREGKVALERYTGVL